MADDELSITFAALADPTRRAILARLATGEATVNELAEPFAMSLQAVSKHLKVLEHAGLISRGRNAQYRPCRLEAEQLDHAIDWIERNKQVWNDRFDRLEQHLRDIQRPDSTTGKSQKSKGSTLKSPRTKSPKTRSPKTKKESPQ
jgi:DNA-binding transcriptional ArsR family regulator